MNVTALRTAVVASVGSLCLTMLPAGPAQAAPGDVTATASVSGTTVTVTVHNGTSREINCEEIGFTDPEVPDQETPELPWFGNHGQLKPVLPGADGHEVSTEVTPGRYHVYWVCGVDDGSEMWGTSPVPESYGGTGTAAPIPVVVGQLCFGSACLPTAFG